MSLVVAIATAHLTHRKRQTLVSVVGVAMGVGFFIAMAALMQGMQTYFITKVIDSWPHIIIKDEFREAPRQPAELVYPDGAVAVSSVKPQDELRGVKNARAILAALAETPGMTAAPTLRTQVFLRYGSKDMSATLVGIDPVKERLVTQLEQDIKEGSLPALNTVPNGIIIGEGVAKKLGISLGNTITATSVSGAVLKMKVAGIFSTGVTALDNFETYALLKKAQVLADRPNVINQVRVRLTDVTEAREKAAELEARWGYKAESWQESYSNVLGLFVIQNAIMYTSVGAILVVAAFGIFNIISTVVHEKSRDIAILKSVGLLERDIRRIFLLEGLVLGVIGALLGWVIGFGLVELLGTVRMNVEGFVKTQGFILYRGYGSYLMAGGFALIAATFAAYLPARKAAMVAPVDIIRGAA